MKTPQELYNERLNRIKTAVALGKPDRVPVVPLGDSFCAKHLGVKVSELCTIPEVSSDTMLKSFTTLGDVDGIQHAAYNVNMLSTIWLSKVKIPGRDLPEGELWQVQEEELMKVEDYDAIINGGYNNFIASYWKDRLDNLGDRVMPFFGHVPVAMKKMEDAGVVPFSPIIFTIPYEVFCGGRSMSKFTRDLYKMPDKVQAAMDAAMPEILETDGSEFTNKLSTWIERLQQWASQNRYLVAHIKSFIEVDESANLWISSTGGKVSAKGSDKWQDSKFASCKVSMTVIIFGPEKHALKAKVTEYFDEVLRELI